MPVILDFPESNDKNQLQQLTGPAGRRIPHHRLASNAFSTAPASAPNRAQIGWPDNSNILSSLPKRQQGAAENSHGRDRESRRLPDPKRSVGPGTRHQHQHQQTQPQSTNDAHSRFVGDFSNHERKHRQQPYFHRHQRPRGNFGNVRYSSPPRSNRDYTDLYRGYSSRDKVKSTIPRSYHDPPEQEDDRYKKTSHPREGLMPQPEPQLQSQPMRTKDPGRHRDYVSDQEKVEGRLEMRERWEEEMREARHLRRVRSFAETQQMKMGQREAKNAERLAELEKLQQSIDEEQKREKIEREVRGEEARMILEQQKREKEETAMKRAAVDQYKLEQKHQHLEEELRRLKLEKLEREFREKVQTELDDFLEHAKGFVSAHGKVEIDEAVDVVHVDDKVTPTELSTRRSVKKGLKAEEKEKRI